MPEAGFSAVLFFHNWGHKDVHFPAMILLKNSFRLVGAASLGGLHTFYFFERSIEGVTIQTYSRPIVPDHD